MLLKKLILPIGIILSTIAYQGQANAAPYQIELVGDIFEVPPELQGTNLSGFSLNLGEVIFGGVTLSETLLPQSTGSGFATYQSEFGANLQVTNQSFLNSYSSSVLSNPFVTINNGNGSPDSVQVFGDLEQTANTEFEFFDPNFGLPDLFVATRFSWEAEGIDLFNTTDLIALQGLSNTATWSIEYESLLLQTGTVILSGAGSIVVTGGPEDASPVPVPAALPLLVTALAGFGLAAWRRKRA